MASSERDVGVSANFVFFFMRFDGPQRTERNDLGCWKVRSSSKLPFPFAHSMLLREQNR